MGYFFKGIAPKIYLLEPVSGYSVVVTYILGVDEILGPIPSTPTLINSSA